MQIINRVEDKGLKIIIRGVVINYLQLVIAFLLNILLTPIMLKYLGRNTYGLWIVFSSVAVYFVLFDIGLTTAVAKYTAELDSVGKSEQLNKVISTTLIILILAGILILLICLGMLPILPRLFQISDEMSISSKLSFLIMGANVALCLISSVFGNFIYGHQRVDVWKAFSIIQLMTNGLLTILFLWMGFGLIGVPVAAIMSSFVLLFLYLWFVYKNGYGLIVRPKLFDKNILKEIAPYSIRTLILGLANRFLWYSSPLIIGIFMSTSDVARFDISYKLCFYFNYLFSIISTTVFPKYSAFFANRDLYNLTKLYLTTTKVSLAIASISIVILIFIGPAFIKLWVGNDNFVGMEVFSGIVALNIFHAMGTPAVSLLQGIGKNKEIVWSEISNVILNIFLCIILIQKNGLFGVVMSILIAHTLTSFWVVQYSVIKYIGLSIREYALKSIIPPISVGILIAFILYLFFHIPLKINNYFGLTINVILVIIVYAIFYIILAISNEERIYVFRLMHMKKNINKY